MVFRTEEESTNEKLVHLTVGGYTYTTTKNVLLTSHAKADENSYFRSLLSGRWKLEKSNDDGDDSISLTIPECNGRLFFYILYYLQMGDLPRGYCSHSKGGKYKSLISRKDLLLLKYDAEFYGLEGLVELCHKLLQVLDKFLSCGDFDVSPYSDIEDDVKAGEYIYENDRYNLSRAYTLFYKYNNTLVGVDFSGDYCYSEFSFTWSGTLSVTTRNAEDGKTVVAVDEESYVSVFKQLQQIITKLYTEADRREKLKVSEVFAQVTTAMIPPELRLWWAKDIFDMIEYYEPDKSWENLLEYALIFHLHYARSWNDIISLYDW